MIRADKIELSWNLGSINELYKEAVIVAKQFRCKEVSFPFNGVKVVVNAGSSDEITEYGYQRIMEEMGRRDNKEAVFL